MEAFLDQTQMGVSFMRVSYGIRTPGVEVPIARGKDLMENQIEVSVSMDGNVRRHPSM